MIELGREKRQALHELCAGSDQVLAWAAVEGGMGRVWVPELKNPSFCLILLGDFVYLFGITPKGQQSMDLRTQLYMECQEAFIFPSDSLWELWLEENFPGQYRQLSRYAMRKDRNNFCDETLKTYASDIPEGIRIKAIDKSLYLQALKEDWSRDFCSNFESPEEFEKRGLGFVALDGRKLVSGCSAYGASDGSMEIQVETRKEYRRKGLALACSARFILTYMEKGVYPDWDAANLQSVGLAEKLGYIFDREYQVYQLHREDESREMA